MISSVFWRTLIKRFFSTLFIPSPALETDVSRSVLLYFCVEFIEIITHTKQKNLQFYFGFPTGQKSLEFIIVFQDSQCSFHLDRTVHPIQDSCLALDIFIEL